MSARGWTKVEEDGARGVVATAPPAPSLLYLLAMTWRGRFAVIMFLGLCENYALRVIMSVFVVSIDKEYDFSAYQKGWLLSSFYVGYALPQLAAGRLAAKFGGHRIVLLSILLPSLLTLLTPAVASSFVGLATLRALTGLTEGACYPALHAVISQWSPAAERSMLVNTIWSGAFLGSAMTLAFAGAIDGGSVPLISGWRSGFYLYGAFGVGWAALFWLLCSSSPETHSFVSAEERAHIIATRDDYVVAEGEEGEGKVAGGGGHGGGDDDGAAEPLLTILPRLFTTPAVWSSIIGHTTHNFAFYLLLSEVPTFLETRLKIDSTQAGSLASFAYIACWAGANLGGAAGDAAISRKVPVLLVRRTAFFFGEVLPALGLVAMGFCDAEVPIVTLLTLSVGILGISGVGYACTPLDIAPKLAGTIMGVQNTFATLSGVIAPLVVSALTPNDDDPEEWRNVFFLTAGVSLFGALSYCALASASPIPRLQPGWTPEENGAERRASSDSTLEPLVEVPVKGLRAT